MVAMWRLLSPLVLSVSLLGQSVRNFEDDDLQNVVDELRPVIERVCGKKFLEAPVAYLADSGDMMRLLRVEMKSAVEREYRGQPRSRIQRALQLRADVQSAGVMGKLEFASGELLVVPSKVRLLLAALELEGVDELAVLKCVIAHEMIHALQHQHLGLAQRFAQLPNVAALDDLNLRIEGHAVCYSEMAIAELGITAGIKPMRAIFQGDVVGRSNTGASLDLRHAASSSTISYLRSAKIFRAVHEASGTEATWRMVAEAGAGISFLRSSKEGKSLADLTVCFDDVDRLLAPKTWTVGKSELSVLQLLSSNYLKYEESLELLQSCEGGAHLHAMGVTPLLHRRVVAMRFEDEQAATRYRRLSEWCAEEDLALARSYQYRKIAEELDLGPTGRERPKTVDGPAWNGFVSRSLVQERKGSRQAAQLVWVQSGRILIEILWVNSPIAEGDLRVATKMIVESLRK